ncbi:MAG TPA: ribosomal-processing cysteine protease Prp [Bacillales bacterium]|nr:ribosomal-processing cysteine protease Prp [Bacillales bacterium]
MVTVEIERQNNQIVSFMLSGHANSGPYGHDLVCAGVSAVSIGTENAVEVLCGVRLITEQADDGGFLRCTVPGDLDEETEKNVQLLLEGMVVSVRAIVRKYGKYIQLKDQGGERHA